MIGTINVNQKLIDWQELPTEHCEEIVTELEHTWNPKMNLLCYNNIRHKG